MLCIPLRILQCKLTKAKRTIIANSEVKQKIITLVNSKKNTEKA